MIRPGELLIDSFAGGGGTSSGIEMVLDQLYAQGLIPERRHVDAAINHDAEAMAMHAANHPATRHYVQNIWQVDPRDVMADFGGGTVGLAWFSPDCKHFSKAKGGQPMEKRIRDLAWVVVHWAKLARPRVIALENVEEFRDWGPLIETACERTGGVKMMPCPARKGLTFRRWVRELRKLGYVVEWRELRACDYGAPTIRKRLFLVARRDGEPIVWPAATHGPVGNRSRLLPYRTAAECIDWSIPCPSIFTRQRPLAEATLRRIARGVMRYVVNAGDPFIIRTSTTAGGHALVSPYIVPITHVGDERVYGPEEPLRTITTAPRGEQALVAPYLVPRYGERPGQEPRCASVDVPISTIVPTANGARLVAAFLAQHNTGLVGHDAREPVSTIVGKGCTQALVTAFIKRDFGTSTGAAIDDPLPTVTADGGGHASLVSAFLTKYYGQDQDQGVDAPLHTATAKARFGLVTVTIAGTEYVIVDIGMRMLTPRELFRAQGFPDGYVIDPWMEAHWRDDVWVKAGPLCKTSQIRMCGNSVCPPMAEALVRANLGAVAEKAVA